MLLKGRLEVVLLVDLRVPLVGGDRVDRDGHAHLGQLRLHELGDRGMRVVGRRVEREAQALRPGLGQQRLRAFGIVGVDGGQVLVPRVRRGNHRTNHLSGVTPDGLEELLAVDGRVDGLAHARVVEGRLRVVEGEQFLCGGGTLGDHEVGVALERGQRVR